MKKLFDEKQILNLIVSTLDVAKVEPLFGKDDISLISFDNPSPSPSDLPCSAPGLRWF